MSKVTVRSPSGRHQVRWVYFEMKSRPDGRVNRSQRLMRKVRTPQGRTVANGDPARSDPCGGTGPQRREAPAQAGVEMKRCGSCGYPTSVGYPVRAHQRRGDADAAVTPVRCKAKQQAMTRPGEPAGWLLLSGETLTTTRRAIAAAEK